MTVTKAGTVMVPIVFMVKVTLRNFWESDGSQHDSHRTTAILAISCHKILGRVAIERLIEMSGLRSYSNLLSQIALRWMGLTRSRE